MGNASDMVWILDKRKKPATGIWAGRLCFYALFFYLVNIRQVHARDVEDGL